MPSLYRKNDWLEFRQEMIERDGNSCCRCGKNIADGVILQVHHKFYVKGRLPWEYSYNDCETICRGCHAEEHGIICPKTGWDFICRDDLEDLCGYCDHCGTNIRYVFQIHHPHWEPMGVGTICCDNLTETKIASNQMESLRRYISRQQRFLGSSRWKNENGNHQISQKRIKIKIQHSTKGFWIKMNDVNGKKVYETEDEAKKKIFEVIENGKAEECLKKRNQKH